MGPTKLSTVACGPLGNVTCFSTQLYSGLSSPQAVNPGFPTLPPSPLPSLFSPIFISYLLGTDLSLSPIPSPSSLTLYFSLCLHLRNPSHRLSLPTLYPLNSGSTYLHRNKEFQFLRPIPVPVDLEKKRSEAKARLESVLKSLTEFKGEGSLSALILIRLGILSNTPDTA